MRPQFSFPQFALAFLDKSNGLHVAMREVQRFDGTEVVGWDGVETLQI